MRKELNGKADWTRRTHNRQNKNLRTVESAHYCKLSLYGLSVFRTARNTLAYSCLCFYAITIQGDNREMQTSVTKRHHRLSFASIVWPLADPSSVAGELS